MARLYNMMPPTNYVTMNIIIKMSFRETGCENKNWNELAQDKTPWSFTCTTVEEG
jgi:hypothetical protein